MEKKKLLFVYYKLFKPGGINRVLTNLVNELAEEYDVTILLLMAEHKPFYPLDERIKLEFIDTFNHWGFRVINQNLRKYLPWLPKRQNIQNYIYDYGVKSMLDDWYSINHHRFDTIISCMYKLSIQASSNSEINQKTIAWEHTDHNVIGKLYEKIRSRNYKNLKSVISINSKSFEFYQKLNSNSLFIPNIIGEPFESQVFNHTKENLMSYVGRLDRDKNVIELLEIFKASELSDDWKLQIIGDGPERRNLENFVRENELEKSIVFYGLKTTEEIVELLQASKIFVFTSLKEAFALVLVEAMFCGNALIAYDCNFGPADIINEKNGFLIPLHDKVEFQKKLQYLIDNPDRLKQLAESSFNESKKWKKENLILKWKEIL